MSVEFWTNAERFYEFWLVIIGILIMLSLMAITFIVSYAKKENKKKFTMVALGLAICFGMTGFIGHDKYNLYLEQAMYSNPLIRDREPRLTIYIYYSSREQNFYTQLNYLESLRNMVLYEEEKIIEPISYLGKEGYFYYFERADGAIFKENRRVEWSDTAQETQLVGSRFTLKDKAFLEIGFKNPENTMFESIIIPVSEQGKSYEPEDDLQIPNTAKEIYNWNF